MDNTHFYGNSCLHHSYARKKACIIIAIFASLLWPSIFKSLKLEKQIFWFFSFLLKIKSGVMADPLIICIDGFLRNFFTWKNALISL